MRKVITGLGTVVSVISNRWKIKGGRGLWTECSCKCFTICSATVIFDEGYGLF